MSTQICATFVLILLTFLTKINGQEPCMLHLDRAAHSPMFLPQILTEDGKFFQSFNDAVKITHGKQAILTCQNQFFKNFKNQHSLNISCNDDVLVMSSDKSTRKFKDLGCDLRVIEELTIDFDKCGKMRGSFYTYFDIMSQEHIKLAEVCYDSAKNNLNFIRTYLSNQYPSEEMKVGKITPKGYSNLDNINIIKTYRMDAVMNNLKTTLGDDFYMAFNYITTVKMLPIMFFDAQLRTANSFPTNYVPMWVSIAKGNWNSLMLDIKSLSKDKKVSLEVVLGTHGTLPIDGKMLYLSGDKFPIPQYTWAVIGDKASKSAVAIITMNNPFIALKQVKEQMFCDDVCSQIKWARSLLKNNNNEKIVYGYTFCCSMDKFKLFSLDYTPKTLLV